MSPTTERQCEQRDQLQLAYMRKDLPEQEFLAQIGQLSLLCEGRIIQEATGKSAKKPIAALDEDDWSNDDDDLR